MKNILLVIAVIIISVVPLLIVRNGDFLGADDKAISVIEENAADYEPWAAPIWEPPSQEIATLLFALQAALGAGVVCFIIGYFVGRRRKSS